MFKTNSEIIKIEAKSQAEIKTGVTFWSHDRGTAKLIFKLIKDGVPQSIPEGTTVPIRLIFKSKTAQDGFGKHDYLATVEDRVNGIISIILEDNILGYIGEVKGSIYLDLPGDRSLDTAGRFNFSIQRSPIDDSTPELEDYYFNGFSQTIDKIEEMISQAENRIDGKVDQIESEIEVLEGKVNRAQGTFDRIEDDLKEAGKLKKVYSNSIEFGDYDYSGNPNLSAKLNASSFSLGTGATVADDNDEIVFTLDGKSNLTKYKVGTQVPLIEGKQYTISCEIMLESDFVGAPSGLRLQHAYVDGGVITLATTTVPTLELNTWQKLSGSAIIKYASNTPKQWYTVFRNVISDNPTGKVRLRNIKVEEGSKATPYQPNLLEAPYYLSKAALGENLIEPESQQPVTNSNYLIKTYNTKPMVKGKKYTITLEGTKPATQTFRPFFMQATGSPWGFGDLKPVEGLTDVWSGTFTAAADSHPTTPRVQIYQVPNTTVGQCTIKWVKLEEGDTRTPNIDQYRYQGLGQTRSSIDKYLWKPFEIKNEFYSNDINFGDYDYSGNPNLMNNLSFSDFAVQAGGGTISDGGKYLKINKTSGVNLFVMAGYKNSAYYLTPVLSNTTYTITYTLRKSSNFVPQSGKRIVLRYRLNQNITTANFGELILDSTSLTEEFTTYTKTFTTGALVNPNSYYFQVLVEEGLSGEIELSYEIKLERDSTATPYQPNIKDAPWYFSKVPLGENIANKAIQFPIKSSEYLLYKANMEEEYILGQTYTITFKGTKPASQTFVAYNDGTINFGNLKPVEGLTDVWSLTFTPTKIAPSHLKEFRIFQYPSSTVGACQIDWLKIEKGDTRTPNILCYKYRGVNNFVSKNPKDYTWDINNDYIQQVFDDTVSLTKPQTIISSKNFEEVPTVKNQPIHYGPQLFEGWYGSGEEHAGMGTKARLRVGGLVVDGRDQLSEPFTWNSGRYEATVNRDITFYCKGTMFVEMGGNIGKYIYIANWKNSEQTQYASGMPAGVGTNLDGGLYYRNMLDFSWVVQLKQGDKFSIGIELADGKTVSKIQIRTLHIKELVSPTN